MCARLSLRLALAALRLVLATVEPHVPGRGARAADDLVTLEAVRASGSSEATPRT